MSRHEEQIRALSLFLTSERETVEAILYGHEVVRLQRYFPNLKFVIKEPFSKWKKVYRVERR